MRKTGCSSVLPPRPLASARASAAALPSTTRSRSVPSSARPSRRSRTRPPTAATGSPSASPWAPAARRISPALPGSRSSSEATDRGSPTGAPGSRRTTPSGPRGPPTRRKGRSGPRRCRTSTSDAVAGATETLPEDGRDRCPAETEGEGAAERVPRRGGPRPADAADDEPRALAVRQAGGRSHGESGRDDHEAPVHQAGRAGIDLRVARAADRHDGAPAHLARRRPGPPLGPTLTLAGGTCGRAGARRRSGGACRSRSCRCRRVRGGPEPT